MFVGVVWPSQMTLVKNLPASAGDWGWILGSRRSPGGKQGNTLQYSCLENPMDRGSWQSTVRSVTKNRTQLKRLSTHVRSFRHPGSKTGF